MRINPFENCCGNCVGNWFFCLGNMSMLDLLYYLTYEVSVPIRSWQSVRAWIDSTL